LDVPESKSYMFKLRSRDGAALFLNGKLVAMNRQLDGMAEAEAEVYLEKGKQPLKINYLKNNPNSYREISLWWYNTEKENFEYIPKELFYYSTSQLRAAKTQIKGLNADLAALVWDAAHPGIKITNLIPKSFKPKVGGMDFHPSGDLVISTWDSLGAVYRLKNIQSADTNKLVIKRIAMGLAEPLGLKVVDGQIFVLQKQELTELIDLNGDEITDEYRTVCNSWGTTGNFHEFAFGLAYKDGYFYAALAIAIQPGGKSTVPQNKDRGKVVKIGMDGSIEFVASGLRTPNGINTAVDNEIFVADNQGDWLPSCKVVHVKKGAFFGNYSVDHYGVGSKKETPPVVWLPQNEIGNSTTQPILLNIGQYKNQMLVGDVTQGGLKRIFIEKVKGEYQGCAFNHTQGFMGGTNRLVWGPDGHLYVGMIGNPGNWGQTGKLWYGIQRVEFLDKPVMEILAIRAAKNGFEIEFSLPLATGKGEQLSDYNIEHWRYEPTFKYGGPKLDYALLPIESITISADRRRVFLQTSNIKEGFVHLIKANEDLQSSTGEKIWALKGYYTLNKIPDEVSTLKGKTIKASQTKAIVSAATQGNPMAKPAESEKKLTEAEEQKMALEGGNLLKPSGCMACHKIDEKILGPSFKAVAAKYPKTDANVKKLIEKVYNGGGGVWGDYEMAGQSHVSKTDIEKMVRYILTLK
jgi:cytochrome c